MIFLRADLSQADSRIVYALSHDPELLRLARSKPWEFDVHKFVGSCIFACPESDIKGDKRQATKKIAHGSHYDEYPQRISDSLLKDGFYVPTNECAIGQARYLGRFPAIQRSYQGNTRMLLIRERALTNSWGRTISFPYERFEPSLYRRGYAWRAASEVADLLNQWGFVPIDQFIARNSLRSRLNLQVHDEVLLSTLPGEAWDIARLLRDSIERERTYEGESLIMPVTLSLELRYHSEELEYKKFPEKEQFEEDFARLWEKRIQ